MGTEPTSRASLSGPASSFRKVWGPEEMGVGTPGLEGVQARKASAFHLNTSGWPTDLQASDGEEAPCTHQRVAGAAEVSSGETLLTSGEAAEGGVLSPAQPQLPGNNSSVDGADGALSADTETKAGEGRYPGAECQVCEKPPELIAR